MTRDILGVLLAGGQSRRMGRPDKFLFQHRDRTLLQHCLERAEPQVNELVISANGDPARLAHYGLEVIPDLWTDYPGPLAGIISVMAWAQKARKDYAWLASFATDTPYFPEDLVVRLSSCAERHKAPLVIAAAGGDQHYTFALWSIQLLPQLLERFAAGERALHRIVQSLGGVTETFAKGTDFFNINTPDDWQALSDRASRF